MKLRNKILLSALPLAIVFAGVTAFVGRRVTEELMVRELGRRVRPQAEDFASGLARGWDGRRETAILSRLQQAQAFSGAAFVEALSPDGRVLAHTNVLETGKVRDDQDARAALAAEQTVYARAHDSRGPLLVLAAPVWRADEDFLLSGGPRKRLGTVRFGLPLEGTLDSARRVGAMVAAMAAGFGLLALALLLAFVRTVLLVPVQALAEATARVAAGNYDVKVGVSTRDELGELANSFNEMGSTLSRTVVSRDRLEEALAISRATLDASADGILVVDRNLRAISHNRRFAEMYGLSDELMAAGDVRAMAQNVRSLLLDEESFMALATAPVEGEQERRDLLRLKDGRVFERISHVYRIGGQAVGRTITTRDMTLHFEGVRALAEARDEAVETARIKSQFLANVSHEIRTPLTAVVGSSEMLLGSKLDDDQREHVDNLNRAARTLLELVNGVLDFSKIEAGRMTVEYSRLQPGALLADAAALLAPRAAEKGLTLRTEGGQAAALELLGDPTRLRQVLLNLLSNAVKFTDRGEVAAAITVLSSDESSVQLEFSVSDSGIGVSPEQAEKLFIPFTQGDGSTTRRFGGTGLGLAISRTLVELMGGTIGFENAPGGGARFWFRLRLARADAASAAAAAVAPEPRAQAPRRDRMRVLVVDDNEINRRLLQRQLERLGYPSESVDSGRAAIEAVGAGHFGMILLDCQMPGLDGYATAAEIRRLEGGRRRTPITAITANATNDVRKRCEEAGMDGFVPKPTTLGDLAAAIERWDQPFDETALAAFAAVAADGAGGLAELLDGFLSDTESRLAASRAALTRVGADYEAVRMAAHAIKGAAASVGARGLAELCRLLETAAEAADAPRESEISALLGQADAEVARLRAEAARRTPA
ncbi:MAG: ATP-binding protein [Elusimicrobiota bacterium]